MDFGVGIVMDQLNRYDARDQSAANRLIQQDQFDRKYDLEKERLDIAKNKAPALNQQKLDAVMRVQNGQGTPQDYALLKATMALEGNKTRYQADEFGNVRAVTDPHPLSQLLGGVDYRTGGYSPQGDEQMGRSQGWQNKEYSVADILNPDIAAQQEIARDRNIDRLMTPAQYDAQAPSNPMTPEDWQTMAATGIAPQNDLPTLPETPRYDGSPKQEIAAGQARVNVQQASEMLPVKAAEKNIDVSGNLNEFMAKEDYKNAIAQANEELKTEKGANQVGGLITRMREINKALKDKNAIISQDQSLGDRVSTYGLTTKVGQEGRKITDPEVQALADEYKKLQSTMLPFYASAAGLGAKSLDSEGERKSILDSFGDPAGIYESNEKQLQNLEQLFGVKTEKPVSQNGWSIKKVR